MIRGERDIRDAYRDRQVAEQYVDQRFREPLGALLHARQVGYLKRLMRSLRPTSVLEIAPGPARLTVELAAQGGTVMDASMEMLVEARRRMGAHPEGAWRFVQGDVFNLPFRAQFDVVYAFRLIRHFDEPARDRIYEQLALVLRPGGVLVFDAVNETVSAPLRRRGRADEHRHYDALLRPDGLRSELRKRGFTVTSLVGVQHRYGTLHKLQVFVAPRSRPVARLAMELVDRLGGGEPLEWIVTCRKE